MPKQEEPEKSEGDDADDGVDVDPIMAELAQRGKKYVLMELLGRDDVDTYHNDAKTVAAADDDFDDVEDPEAIAEKFADGVDNYIGTWSFETARHRLEDENPAGAALDDAEARFGEEADRIMDAVNPDGCRKMAQCDACGYTDVRLIGTTCPVCNDGTLRDPDDLGGTNGE